MTYNWLLVALGGAIGSVTRYTLSDVVQKNFFGTFPLGTLFVNSTGCFLIGILGALILSPIQIREDHRVFMMVGVMGGYTTFSAFGWETVTMLNNGQSLWALFNIAANNLLSLAGVWAGFRLGKFLLA